MPPHTVRHLDEMLPWNDKLQMLECIAAVEEAPDVMTFSFRTPDQNWFRYAPGQFVTLELPVSPEPAMRTYTLSSTPSRPYSLAVTVKAQQGSVGTRWMLDHLRPGMRIRAYGPAGDFSLASHPDGKYLFISAGSGITPMMSMTRWLHDCAPATDIAFINCARRPDEIIFHDELRLLAARMAALKLSFIAEQSSPRHAWSGLHGRIDRTRLELLAPDFNDRTVFCCGPEPFMRAVREALQAMGFDMARYHQESFQPAAETVVTPTSPAGDDPGAMPQTATVRFTRSGVEVECGLDDTILLAARSAGLKIPSACEFGVCGTCKVLCGGGETVMNHNGGIRDDEIGEGYILACCTRPVGPVEIDI
ncbi:hybrid-cluster NAD(P)-dependent oxidoreductase [Paramesorhizobium deserti]|uniref:Hybrid-cluster NAD(P)-dependent oxidoreductase n=1 Tax=Paramesorhizobium deserti TaxID=1494590 RepID=A0A135HV78_9HYPH|nr:hybrid-cluster NAD(P)-dependent oxidoreductase [Paramesorhizobium deserti]KXF77089.1 hybrid-cluster NAD(P)-dependent oxidoreductase [Paramesorhizobium deserti]